MNREILGSVWFTNNRGVIGVVAARTGMHAPEKGEWKAYIGIGYGRDIAEDAEVIADYGNGLSPERAHGFFPHLDISKYKDS